MNPIVVDSLRKTYGSFEAVGDCSFEIPEGSICGLLGPNGAGKSSTFKCMLGLARPTGGRVLIGGAPPRPEMFESLAFVPEKPALYENLTARDHLAMARHSFASYDARRAAAMLEIFALTSRKKVRTFSKGQRTALGLALAFAVRPTIMILDEPASGLDPMHQRSVLDLLIEAAAQGTTILLSSHQIGQVERAADRVIILKRGRVVLEGDLDTLRADEKVVEAVFAGPFDGAHFAADARVRRVETRGHTVRLTVHTDATGVARDLDRLSPAPASVVVLDQNLEELFFSAVAEARPATLEAD